MIIYICAKDEDTALARLSCHPDGYESLEEARRKVSRNLFQEKIYEVEMTFGIAEVKEDK